MDQRSSVSYGTWLPTGGTGNVIIVMPRGRNYGRIIEKGTDKKCKRPALRWNRKVSSISRSRKRTEMGCTSTSITLVNTSVSYCMHFVSVKFSLRIFARDAFENIRKFTKKLKFSGKQGCDAFFQSISKKGPK
jgi:hypothetical protein